MRIHPHDRANETGLKYNAQIQDTWRYVPEILLCLKIDVIWTFNMKELMCMNALWTASVV
jgi:hypothetical protein